MSFTVQIEVADDGAFNCRVLVPDGHTVFRKHVTRMLAQLLGWATEFPDARLNTLSEQIAIDAARKIPDGWEVTLDAPTTNIDVTNGGQTCTRTYARAADGAVATVPCAPDGSAIPETREALIAYHVANPVKMAPEA